MTEAKPYLVAKVAATAKEDFGWSRLSQFHRAVAQAAADLTGVAPYWDGDNLLATNPITIPSAVPVGLGYDLQTDGFRLILDGEELALPREVSEAIHAARAKKHARG